LAILAGVAWLLHLAAAQPPVRGPLSLRDAKRVFPDAARLDERVSKFDAQTVRNARGEQIGSILTTSPQADELVGYTGSSNLLVGLDREGRIVAVEILASGDTTAHVEEVRRSALFWKQLLGWRPTDPPPQIEGVSGSTLTSLTMAEGVMRRLRGSEASLRFPEPVALEEIQKLFPQAQRAIADGHRTGWHQVLDARGRLLGYAVRSSPFSDNVRGYQGPTETLAAVSVDGKRVLGVRLRKSFDTPEYVDRVREDEDYLKLLSNLTTDHWATIDYREAGIEGVSGATQTSFAVAEGLHRRFAADQAEPKQESGRPFAAASLLTVIAGALAITFTPLRTKRWLKSIWNSVLVLLFALWLGDLLSLSLMVGWARHGIPWQSSPTVVLLLAVALVVPWTTRRNVYCQHICPHGAAQTWLGRFKRLHIHLPPVWNRWLSRGPLFLLAIGAALGLFHSSFDLARLEPFDAWVLKGAALTSACIAILGLAASLFVPQAYCRFGCPTGALLGFVRSGGKQDRFTRRDMLAGLCLLVFAVPLGATRIKASLAMRRPGEPSPNQAAVPSLQGAAFGTTWSVKFRGPPPANLHSAELAAELERVESTLSHWRPDSATSQFNGTETTFATEQPTDLVALVDRALAISRATGGAYDITVAPLVSAWGFGPSGEIASIPTEAEIGGLLVRTGYQKLHADLEAGTLQKDHAELGIDLGSLLQGYAADKLAERLSSAGAKEFLIDVGGELVAKGEWEVAIEDPRANGKPLARVELTNQALATSGLYRAKRALAETTVHHLIDPRTGHPVTATAQLCAVVAPSGVEADAWATALLAVGLPEALPLADEQGLAALLLDNEGRVHRNERGKAIFGDE
jgi:thiamine biosynthesis lipoprotein ApbE/Na+-translocating ferredoxin:NAD+ oxidoreductase RnfG subunit